ncbi:Zinc finger, C2H2 [Kalmanozyma brasiliensis GHG001]|uniref:Zinc finger, C2H2 n=1 Tax=Kalmanozyma brasiliensis (strain GHG001) TaxID=1365824 RepID=UPI002867ED82|nr:Zinc finger, C2H2 [Kalmanozyma brasiliensis GHG001]EST05635.2 Zinc finger, C2H2 [Kalmanozyma brasiliensis GHG001]
MLGSTELFAKGAPTTQSTDNGGAVRKKRRRYGPKPEPPYTCFCGKVFKRHEHMLRHRATHDDSIRYTCHICGKCFRRQDVMHRHTMTHIGRDHQQSKMRNTASSPSSSLTRTSASAATATRRRAIEGSKSFQAGRQRHNGHAQFDYSGNQHGLLEDPSLRVGLGDDSSAAYNEDHHIAAAQLQNACMGVRHPYMAIAANNTQPIMMSGEGLGPVGYVRSDGMDVTTDYHSRSAVSPPDTLYTSAHALSSNLLQPGQFGASFVQPQLQIQMGQQYEYDVKPNVQELAQQYAHGWHGGPGLSHGTTQVPPPESEWSEQSPSGPSPHSFASPAWSQKAELMAREHAEPAANRTPLGLISNRQLSTELGTRWQPQQSHYQPYQQQQQQQSYQVNSPLLGANSAHQYSLMNGGPAQGLPRRSSGPFPQNGWGGSPHAANDQPRNPHQTDKTDGQREVGGAGLGLDLFHLSHAGDDAASLSLGTLPHGSFSSDNNDRPPALQRQSSSSPIAQGASDELAFALPGRRNELDVCLAEERSAWRNVRVGGKGLHIDVEPSRAL